MSKASNYIVDERTHLHLVDLRTASALVREGDWRRIAETFKGHKFKPLAFLAAGCADTMLSVPHHAIAPSQILTLCDPAMRDAIAELLAIFGAHP